MTDRSDRFQHGLDVYDVMTAKEFGNELSPGLKALESDFPFLVDATMSYAIGDVWGRTQMHARTRELAMIAALGVVGAGAAVQLRQHVEYALNLGVSADEVRELVYLTSVAAGFPRALNMAAEVKAVFEAKGIPDVPAERSDTPDRHQRGLDKMAQLGREEQVDIAAHPVLGPLSRAFPFLIDGVIEYAMGDVWTRPALDIAIRQVATVAAFAALGDAWPQVKLHTGHALRLGVSRETLAEVVNLLTVAVGFPVALNAAAAIREVFDQMDA
ncbi:carboxymuconolactone decarboxylase family protein [Aureimonas sp. OT7]|uniref:carboxymuconolactone decarboxylase family protein n=1 Tax=Aureimonas sp. OT7 TaxID=2816454 RepID=UPI00177DDA04|nr:carboxymuconolactone decarboxylase family protein [Aureimonas sp. OT7]QOG07387.1 carboxymuconolactone decarboxylase family protein [Aureimonas sp. OT7]